MSIITPSISASAVATAASTTAFSSNSSSTNSNTTSALTQQNFLQLLTAQLKYQTPSSPADPTQLASEFAAISTVNGITQLNSQVSSIQTAASAAQVAQASNLVGKQIAVSGNMITANSSGIAAGAFDLSSATKLCNVTIFSPTGSEAGTMNLGALPAGQQSFTWQQGISGSQYTYQVNAVDSTGAAVPVVPYSVYTVNGVNVSGSTPTLNVQGSATPLPISSVQTVLGTALP